MRAAELVGRVGGLAVALGVGAAMATGVAAADTPGSDAPDKSSVSADPQGSAATDTTKKTATTDATKPPALSATSSESSTPSSRRSARTGGLDLTRTLRRAVERGVAVSNGGALSSAKASKDTADTTKVDAPKPPVDQSAEDDTDTNAIDAADAVDPTVKPDDTAAAPQATPRTEARSNKVFSRLAIKAAQAPTVTTPNLPAVRDIQATVQKVVKDAGTVAVVNDDVETSVRRAVDTAASITGAVQPLRAARSLNPLLSIDKAAAVTDLAEVATPVAPVARVLSSVLSAIGFSPGAANSPVAPVEPVGLLALMAWGSRREYEQSFATMSQSAATATTPVSAAARTATPLAAAAVTTPPTVRIGWMTGANSINDTVNRFGIAGTDVGVMWDNGITKDNPATQIVEQRQVLIAFGDTFSGANMTGIWRNNVLLRSADGVLSDGLYVPDGIIHDPGAYSGSPMSNPNFSREIIGKYGYAVGSEVTIIPTAAISVAGAGANGATRQYVQFMSVRSWDTPGKWTTNYSGIIWSDDNGQNWTVVPSSGIRPAAAGRSTMPYVKGNENFQQGAFVKPPAGSADAAAGWVYSYGTPAGRGGTVYLSRVNEKQILDQTKYEYWNGSSWVKNQPSAAKPILPGTTTSSFFGFVKTTTYPTAGEMSVQYNTYLKKYVMLYTDQNNNVVMRTSTTPQGTWSTPKTLVTSTDYPGLYAPMIHPWSGTSQLKKADGSAEDPQYLYWGLSQWNEYNVAMMRTDLSRA